MRTYQVEIAELQVWRICIEVKAKDEKEAREKAKMGDGEVITQGLKDVDHVEVLDIEKIKEV